MKLAITGANSSVGIELLRQIAKLDELAAIAGVRSAQAAAQLPPAETVQPALINYTDADALAAAFAGADVMVHLAGVLVPGTRDAYRAANVAATATALQAAKKLAVKHFVFVSVVGADPGSDNAFWRSKGEAEQLVQHAGLSATILQTPLLLGQGSAGTAALQRQAQSAKVWLLNGGRQQVCPLDSRDLCSAIIGVCRASAAGVATYVMVGPEALSYRALVERAAYSLRGESIRVATVPLWLAKLATAINGLRGVGMTPTVLQVIASDEPAGHTVADALNIPLTPLADTLSYLLPRQAHD